MIQRFFSLSCGGDENMDHLFYFFLADIIIQSFGAQGIFIFRGNWQMRLFRFRPLFAPVRKRFLAIP